MKYGFIFLGSLAALLFCTSASAQVSETTGEMDVRARTVISVSHKFSKKFSLKAAGDFRFYDNLSSLGSGRASLEGEYRINKYLGAELGYCFISNSGDDIRHRAIFALTGDYKFSNLHLSLSETFHGTTLMKEFNRFQQPRTRVEALTSLKAELDLYNAPFLTPYAEITSRHLLNGARYLDTRPESMTFTDFYLNRIRTKVGCEWSIDRRSKLDLSVYLDNCTDRDIDAKKDGTLKAITVERKSLLWIGIAYKIKI